MRKLTMFITAVCVLFLIKLPWPKKKSLCDTIFFNIDTVRRMKWTNNAVKLFSLPNYTFVRDYRLHEVPGYW